MSKAAEAIQLAKDEILDLRFPYKLWILVNMANQIVTWGEAGTSIILDYVALNLYLFSAASIFKLKTGRKFLRQLTSHGFEKVSVAEESPAGVILEFRHANFVRDREDLLGQICYENTPRKQMPRQKCHQSLLQSQRPLDPCFSQVRPLAAMERARLNLRMFLQMQNENFSLNRKLSECERKSPASAVSVIELPADAFENPFDSVSQFEENTEYAGYYGTASTEQIKQFFDEYLPVYAQTNDEVNEATANHASEKVAQSKQFSYVAHDEQNDELRTDSTSNPTHFQINYSVDLEATASGRKEFALNVSEDTVSRVASSGIASDDTMSSFAECQDTNYAPGRDEDISMDEYLKFKDSPATVDSHGNASETTTDVKPDLDGLVAPSANETTCSPDEWKEENTEEDVNDEGDESNFKNFFDQYRRSINLLYE